MIKEYIMCLKGALKKFWLNKEKFLYLHRFLERSLCFSDVLSLENFCEKVPTENKRIINNYLLI